MPFTRSLDLSRMLYEQEIRPLMEERFPNLPHAAATLGMCSEVLGLDDEVSMDHEWGPRLGIFLSEDDYSRCSDDLTAAFRECLPSTFQGLNLGWRTPGVDIHDTRERALYHVWMRTVSRALGFCGGEAALPLEDMAWLAISEQHLLEFTAGEVYRDDTGDLTRARESLRYYPDNVLRLLLMQEWAVVHGGWFPIGRMGSKGDALGVRLQAARVAQHLMRIAFMLSRRYIPYRKWFGTLFLQLPIAAALQPILAALLNEGDWRKVEERICEAASLLLERQNASGIAPAIPIEVEAMHDGRHHVGCAFGRVTSALTESVRPPLDAVMQNQVSWLHERSLILWQDEVGKWLLFLRR